jgi:hypothetical protein
MGKSFPDTAGVSYTKPSQGLHGKDMTVYYEAVGPSSSLGLLGGWHLGFGSAASASASGWPWNAYKQGQPLPFKSPGTENGFTEC